MGYSKNRINQLPMADSSPEKAGVGGSIPSLATMFSTTYRPSKTQLHSISFQNFGLLRLASPNGARSEMVWGALDSASNLGSLEPTDEGEA